MVIAGAGGHALELLDIIISQGKNKGLKFFDDLNEISFFQDDYPVINNFSDLKKEFKNSADFFLGVGNPIHRHYFYQKFTEAGGLHKTIKGSGVVQSNFIKNNHADVFNLCFIGANVSIGLGTLVNTAAQIHHEVEIGEFCEINPGATLLGKVKIGNFSTIGANSTVLPKIQIGSNVTVGAGSVVTKNIPDNVLVVGVPATIVKSLETPKISY